MNPYDMIYDLNDEVNKLTRQLEIAKASLSRWESVFGHLGTPDEVGNEWAAMSDRLEAAEKDAAHQKALAESALRVAGGWERKCGELRARKSSPATRRMTMWQPIETAPRNQMFLAVLNCAGEQTICTMRWAVAEEKNNRPEHYVFHVERVTHWMPLPDLPGAQAQHAPSVPDKVEVREDKEGEIFSRGSYNEGYDNGWNDCIDAMLAEAPNERSEYPEAKQ